MFLCIDDRIGFFDVDDTGGDDDKSLGDFVWNGLTFAVGRLWWAWSDVEGWEILFNIGRWFNVLGFWLKEGSWGGGGGNGGAGVEETSAPS